MTVNHAAIPAAGGDGSATARTSGGPIQEGSIGNNQAESPGYISNGVKAFYSAARKGKIARLPQEIREELNGRLEDGEKGASLLAWLNGQTDVRKILDAQFGGLPISKQNLSEWRQGGYREWKIREDLLDHGSDLADFSAELDNSVDADFLGDHLTKLVTVRYAALLRGWNGEPDAKFEAELRVMQRLSQEVLRLQKGVHRASRFNAEWEERVQKKFDEEKEKAKDSVLGPFYALLRRPALVKLFGGGEWGEKVADFMNAVHYDLPLPKDGTNATADNAGQTKSNEVKPDLPQQEAAERQEADSAGVQNKPQTESQKNSVC